MTRGVLDEPVIEHDERVVHARALSSFSRMVDHERFIQLASAEIQRRGIPTAALVCTVNDGANWIQAFIDTHRRDTIRILDFPQALEHVSLAGQTVYGRQSNEFQAWLGHQRRELKAGSPAMVIEAVRALTFVAFDRNDPEAAQHLLQKQWEDLKRRQTMMDDARFQALGDPIGSGAGESANKLVVERRPKGAGMQWANAHVDPMLALTTAIASRRWPEVFPAIRAHCRAARRTKYGKTYSIADSKLHRVAERQGWRCPICQDHLFNEERIHIHHEQHVADGGTDAEANLTLVHAECHKHIHGGYASPRCRGLEPCDG
ncbi:MAG: HNH endonuclease [Ardenticatenaceae bacterium]|nr:HNH endonuclease [Ardenticatenaceae bacterium]